MEMPVYAHGSQLTLFVREDGRDSAVPRGKIAVDILELLADPTMSMVAKVSFCDARSGNKQTAILKMFDRRQSLDLRRTYNQTYEEDIEATVA